MQITGQALLRTKPRWLKFIFNEFAIAFSIPSLQHSEITAEGVRYQDSGGNALAGQIINGGVEIRGNQALGYSEDRVRSIWQRILSECKDDYLSSLTAKYQTAIIYLAPEKPRLR